MASFTGRRRTNKHYRTLSVHVDGRIVDLVDTYVGDEQRFISRSEAVEEAMRIAARWWATEDSARNESETRHVA